MDWFLYDRDLYHGRVKFLISEVYLEPSEHLRWSALQKQLTIKTHQLFLQYATS